MSIHEAPDFTTTGNARVTATTVTLKDVPELIASDDSTYVRYSNDVLGEITGTVDMGVVTNDGKATLRFYINKQDTSDAPDDILPYPKDLAVEVQVDEDGKWRLSEAQKEQVLQHIWWADQLRNDNIYLQVKAVDPVTGKSSEASARYTFVTDTYAPEATNVIYDGTTGANGRVTALVTGDSGNQLHAKTGDAVTVTYDGVVFGSGFVGDPISGSSGYLQIQVDLTQALPSGEGFDPGKLKVHVTDQAGNTGASNNETLDPGDLNLVLPKPEISAYIDGKAGGIVGNIGSGGLTNDNKGLVTGTIDLGTDGAVDQVWVYLHNLPSPIKIDVPTGQTGVWTWTVPDGYLNPPATTTGTLADGLVRVRARAYDAQTGILGEESDEFTFTVDVVPPTVAVNIVAENLIAGQTSEVTFSFSEAPVDFTLDDLTVVGGELSNLVQSGTNPALWTALFTPSVGSIATASVTVNANSYTDAAGNSGAGGTDSVGIDTEAPTVTVQIAHDTLLAGEASTLTLIFSKVPHGADGQPFTAGQVAGLLVSSGGQVTIGTLTSNDGGYTWTGTIQPGSNLESTIALEILAGSYRDAAGNLGGADSDSVIVDTLPPLANNDVDNVTESTAAQPSNKAVATGNVLTNDTSGATAVLGFKVTIGGTDHTAVAGDTISTQYGTVTIAADGAYTYTLDNSRETTQQLNASDAPVESIVYTVRDASGNVDTATLGITVNGRNDAPVIEVETGSDSPTVSGGNQGGGAFSSVATAVNQNPHNNSSTHNLSFSVANGAESTVRAVVNLDRVDNTFSILVNGTDIFASPNGQTTIFQLESGDGTTGIGANVVALRFADGTWLSAGAPWDAHANGLPRFQVIMTENGVRFYATRTTTASQLEEIFIGTHANSGFNNIFPQGLTNPGLGVPDFIAGQNTVRVVNPNGVGQDLIQGYLTVTSGGTFDITDWDDANIAVATITLQGRQTGDNLIAVLPQGITANTAIVNGNLVMTLSGPASLADFEDAIRSVMFQSGAAGGERTVRIQLTDENGGQSNVLEGTVGAGSRSLAASGTATVTEWTAVGFKVAGYTNASLFSDGQPAQGLLVGSSLDTALLGSSGVAARNVTSGFLNASERGNGIGVGTNSDNARISDNESLVIDAGYDARSATITLTNFTSGESAQWHAYDAQGVWVASGTLNGSGSSSNNNDNTTRRSYTLNIDDDFRYLVVKAGNGDFLVDGLAVVGRTDVVTIGEFAFEPSSGQQGLMQLPEVEMGTDTLLGAMGSESIMGIDEDSLDDLSGDDGPDDFLDATHSGNELVIGSLGNDILQGSADADHFVFDGLLDNGDDVIMNFSSEEGDKLAFSNIAELSELAPTWDETSHTLSLSNGSTLQLTGVTMDDAQAWLAANAIII